MKKNKLNSKVPENGKSQKSTKAIRLITILAFFLSISLALAFLEFPIPIPLWPPYLEMDLSFVIIGFALLILGFEYAIVLCILKNWIKFLIFPSIGGFAGPLLNTILGIAFILSMIILNILVSKIKLSSQIKILIYLFVTCIFVSIISGFCNYLFILPIYGITDMNLAHVMEVFAFFTLFKFSILSLVIWILVTSFAKYFESRIHFFQDLKTNKLQKVNHFL